MKTWSDIERADNSEIIDWAKSQAWARDMAACQQDAQWHAEGDVWTHTQMVCTELERLEEWPSLTRCEQVKLLFTALFHDSGKPATTALDPASGRTRSPKHALVGATLARNALRALGCNVAIREQIASLVRYHGRPPYLLEKEDPEREVISLSWLVNNRLLYLFALADTRGRLTKETTRSEDNLHLWKLAAEESQCFHKPYTFANDQARFLFYRDQLGSLHYTPHEGYRCTVTLMSGLPGSGKDTWIATNRSDPAVVSLDSIRDALDIEATDNQGEVIQTAREGCREYLRSRRNFIFNATNITRQIRKRWIDLFADYGARVEIVYIEPPIAVILTQNKARHSSIPEGAILRLLEKLEPPTITECHAIKVVES